MASGTPPAPYPVFVPRDADTVSSRGRNLVTLISIGLAAFAGASLIGLGVGANMFVRPALPEHSPPPQTGLVAVPDLMGVKESQAQQSAKAHSLKLQVTTGASREVAAGCVMTQYPTAGQAVKAGSTLRVRISTGLPGGSAMAARPPRENSPTIVVVRPEGSTVAAPRTSTPERPPQVSVPASSYGSYLTETDLAGKSNRELDIMRNTIYARHGRVFQRSDLQVYFDRQPWYRRNYRFRDSWLSPSERRQAAFIASYQKRYR